MKTRNISSNKKKGLKHVFVQCLMIVSVCIGLHTHLLAQTTLSNHAYDQIFNHSGAYEDVVIPTTLSPAYNTIRIQAKAGDGGEAKVEDVSFGKICKEAGGIGATITAEFLVGDEAGMIPKGSSIRLVIGGKGDNDSNPGVGSGWSASAGGGGTGVLFKAPDSTNWELLVAAGGGAGSYQGMLAWNCIDDKSGEDGRDNINGGNGEGPSLSNPGDGGTNGNGGGGGGTLNDLSGGGGGYLSKGGGVVNLYGRVADTTGGEGGYANNILGTRHSDVPEGGWGFGGGGAGDEGGGGGGGYSGGGGGAKQGRGGAGGSYTNPMAFSSQFENEVGQIDNGYTIINFEKTDVETVISLSNSGSASLNSSNLAGNNCGIVNFDPLTVDCSQVGIRAVTVTGTNSAGEQISCKILMEIKDEVAPQALCQSQTIYLDANGQASITNEDIDNGSNDACGAVSLSLSQYDFDCSHVGANDVILAVTDVNGNVATCTTTVTVVDQMNPAISAVSDITANTSDDDRGDCDVVISWTHPTFTDNCDLTQTGTSLSYTLSGATVQAATSVSSFNGSSNASETFNIGTTVVTYSGTDPNGNAAASMSFEVMVTDDEIPVIANMSHLTPNTSDDGMGDCMVDVVWNHPAFSDNCNLSGGTTSLQYVLSGATTKSAVSVSDFSGTTATMETFELGVTTVTYTGTDANGNDAVQKSFTVTVSDDEMPILVANPPVVIWNPDHNYQTFTLTDMIASFSDNCDQTLALTDVVIVQGSSDEPENSTADGNTWKDILISNDCQSVQFQKERKGNGDGRVYTITLAMTDASGNTGTVDFEVHVPNSNNGQAVVNSGVAYTEMASCGGTAARKVETLSGPSLKVFPNPFQTSPMIQFELAEAQSVQIQVFNMNGQVVRHLHAGPMAKGQHSIKWNGANDHNQQIAEGIYVVRILVGEMAETKHVILVK